MADTLKVVLVDDSKLVLVQLERLVAGVEGVELVGKAYDGASAVRMAALRRSEMTAVMPKSINTS